MTLDDYHEQVQAWLRSSAPWLTVVGSYPDVNKELPTPSAWLNIISWTPLEKTQEAQLKVRLLSEVLLLSPVEEGAEIRLRQQAMVLSQKMHHSTLDIEALPVDLIRSVAQPAFTQLTLPGDTYCAWLLRYRQIVTFGEPEVEPSWLLSLPKVAINPEDPAESDYYQPIHELIKR